MYSNHRFVRLSAPAWPAVAVLIRSLSTEFFSCVGAERVVGGEAFGAFLGEAGFESALLVEGGEFFEFSLWFAAQFGPFSIEVSLFGVCLGADRHVFAGCH